MKHVLTFLLFIAAWVGLMAQTVDKQILLKQVIERMDSIHNACYYQHAKSWMPGDTLAQSYHHFTREYILPQDTTIGAAFIETEVTDTTIVTTAYDGTSLAYFSTADREVSLNDFSTWKLPFRPVSLPFMSYCLSILKYVLQEEQSVQSALTEEAETWHLKLVIEQEGQVEFFGKAYIMPSDPVFYKDPLSIYDLWIDKQTLLPTKVRRVMSHQTTENTYTVLKLNPYPANKTINIQNLIPVGYEIRRPGDKASAATPAQMLVGKQAPDWTLSDAKGRSVKLADLKDSVVVISFTGIGCGPCHASIPFLNSMHGINCQVVAIESWGHKPHSLQVYIQKNGITYPLLTGNDDVLNAYLGNSRGVPLFFVIDANHIIQQVFNGFDPKRSPETIKKAIEKARK